MHGSSELAVRRRVIFHGRVQGVGFRMTTAGIARRYPVTGYVRNLPDGTVELVADGQPDTLDTFVAAVEDAFRGLVTDTAVSEVPRDEAFSGFEIRR